MLTASLLVIAVSLLLYLLWLGRRANRYWSERGIRTLPAIPFLGNTLPIVLKRKNLAELYLDLATAFPNEQLTGFYSNMKPNLVVQDPEYAEKVLIKDFAHFTDHSMDQADPVKSPIDHYQLFGLRGAKWRAFRYKMTPLFTSGKLRQMFESLDVVGAKLLEHINRLPAKGIVLKDVIHLYTLDFVGLAVFGLNPSCLEHPGSEYHQMGTNVFDMSYYKLVFATLCPRLFYRLGFSFNNKKSVRYFCGVLREAFRYRREHNVWRNDFIQMMMQLKEKGRIEVHKWDPNDDYLKEQGPAPSESFELTDESLLALGYTFMTTGLDGVSLAGMFVFYDLACHPEVQEQARAEVLAQIHAGLTYDALKSMSYLENVINESMRLHPLSQSIFRVCTKEYTFPNGYKVQVGDVLHVPTLAIHRNPNFHPDPDQFRPERFQSPVKPCSFLPFGDGPRVCIAMRFAMLQVKYAVAKILSKYTVKLNPKTELPLRMMPQSLIVQPIQTLYFDLEER